MVTDYRHTRRGAIWCEDAGQQRRGLLPTAHTACHRANKTGFNPTGREETCFRPGGGQGGSARCGRRWVWAKGGRIAAGAGGWDCWSWCQPAPVLGSGGATSQGSSRSSLPAHPSLSTIVFPRAFPPPSHGATYRTRSDEATLFQRVQLYYCCLPESCKAGDLWSLLLPLKKGKALSGTTICHTRVGVSQKCTLCLLMCCCCSGVAPLLLFCRLVL